MAGFEVTPYGRFCLTPEVNMGEPVNPVWREGYRTSHARNMASAPIATAAMMV
jgi:hypothetical protein